MTDKEKYIALMERYWKAETSPAEERALARYVVQVDDPEFDGIRGVLGYLSIGRAKRVRRSQAIRRYYVVAAAACIIIVLVFGLGLRQHDATDICVRYAYGELMQDHSAIMNDVELSLNEFFAGSSPAETNLIQMFQR